MSVTAPAGPASSSLFTRVRPGPSAPEGAQVMRQFPPRECPGWWPGTAVSREEARALLTAPPFRLGSRGGQQQRGRILGQVLDWLGGQPGGTWQERWAASGAAQAGVGWREIAATWLCAAGRAPAGGSGGSGLGAGLLLMICGDLIRPDPGWLLASSGLQLLTSETIADPQAGIADAVRRGAYGDTADWQATESGLLNMASFSELADDEVLIESRDGGISRFPYRTILSHRQGSVHAAKIPDAIAAYDSSHNLVAKRLLARIILHGPLSRGPGILKRYFSEDAFFTYLGTVTITSSTIFRYVNFIDFDDRRWDEAFSRLRIIRYGNTLNILPPVDISRISTRISNDQGRGRGLLVLLAATLINGAPADAVSTTFIPIPSDTPQTRVAIAVIRILSGTRVRDIADQLRPLRGGRVLLTAPLFDAIETLELSQAEECSELLALSEALDLDQSALWPRLRMNQSRRSSPLVTPDGWTQLGYPATISAVLAH